MSRIQELQLNDICRSLQSEDKSDRLRALETFKKMILNPEKEWTKSELLEVWQTMNKHISTHLTDPAESCRTLCIEITKILLESLPVFEKNIIYLVPVLVRRLGSQEILEPSEEVRLNFVILLRVIIQVYKEHLGVYMDALITILARTVVDSYSKVKMESCEAISELAKSAPVQFYPKTEAIAKAVLSNLNHRHHQVRATSVRTVGDILQHGDSKCMGDVASSLATRLFDQNGTVRAAVTEVAGNWLLNLRDRYSYWAKLLPLLLTGLHDEIEGIRVKAQELWEAVGLQYLKENESDEKLKNKMDYLITDLVHYPPEIKRPNLGCRTIVQLAIGKLVDAICKELTNWQPEVRVRSAQLVAVLILNAEEKMIQYIEKLLPSMYKACIDEDKRVIINVITAAEYMGYFVPPDSYCRLVLPTLENENVIAGHLAVFAAILRCSEQRALSKELDVICDCLRQPHLCRSKRAKYQQEILRCCEALLLVCQKDCSRTSDALFSVVFTVWSMAENEDTRQFAERLMRTLSEITDSENLHDLYTFHLPSMLNDLKNSCATWTPYSAELSIFRLCLTEAQKAAWENFGIILSILKKTMGQDCDIELKLSLLILLSQFFKHGPSTCTQSDELNYVVVQFLDDILIPSLVWTAGRSSEALRTAAIACLCALLDDSTEEAIDEFSTKSVQGGAFFSDQKKFSPISEKLRPILVSLIDDNSQKTRLLALRALYLLIKHALNTYCTSEEDVMETYPGIIRRLNDGCDDVRCAAVQTLVFVWKALPKSYDLNFGKSHLDYLYTSVIIHLDDPEVHFQTLILDAMTELAKIHPVMLMEKIEKCKPNFRNQKGLEVLINQCHTLLNAEK